MASDRRVVLDASALLAAVYDEPGAERVREVLDVALISTVNLAEVVGKLRGDAGWSEAEVAAGLDIPLEQIPFDAEMASVAGNLLPNTRHRGLSLGDRACLATARCLGVRVVLTADAAWAKLGLVDLDIELLR